MGGNRQPVDSGGRIELARLLVIRNVAVVFIALATAVAIVGLTAPGRAARPTRPPYTVQPAPAATTPPSEPQTFHIDPAQTWSYADVNNANLSAHHPAGKPIEYTWACGCKDVLDPSRIDDLFIRSDPQAEVRRREKQVCYHCAAAMKYLDWKAQHGR